MTWRRRSKYKCHRNATPFWGRSSAHDDSRLPLRAEPERLSASRPRALRARQFRHGPRGRRPRPRDPDGAPLYPGNARSLPEAERRRRMESGEPYALRLDMAAALAKIGPLTWIETDGAGKTSAIAASPQMWGDVVLARKETPTSYHLSVVIDDAEQGVTHVVRGRDLFAATAVHRVLQALFALPAPIYHHHRLILDADGQKLSKSTRATALRALRENGATSADIRRMVGLA